MSGLIDTNERCYWCGLELLINRNKHRKKPLLVVVRSRISCWNSKYMLPGKSLLSVAQQLLCACISAVMRSHNTCCASVKQLLYSKICNSLHHIVIPSLVTLWLNHIYQLVYVLQKYINNTKLQVTYFVLLLRML